MWHTGPQHSIIGIETDTIPSFFFLQSEDMFLTDLILRHHPCGWTDSLFILCETFDDTSLSNEHQFTNCSFKLALMNTNASKVLLWWINICQHCMHNDPAKQWTAAQQRHLLSQQSWDQCVWFHVHLCWFCSPSVRSTLRQTSFQVDFGGEETVGSSIRLLILSSELVWMSPFFFCGMRKWCLSLRANSWFLGSFLKASSNVLLHDQNGGMWNVNTLWPISHMTGISSVHFVKWASAFVIVWPTFVNIWFLFRTLTKQESWCRKHQFVILRSTRVQKGVVTLGFNMNFFIITFIITVLCKKRHDGAVRNVVIRHLSACMNQSWKQSWRMLSHIALPGWDTWRGPSSQKGSVTWNFHMMASKGVKFCKLWRSGGWAP